MCTFFQNWNTCSEKLKSYFQPWNFTKCRIFCTTLISLKREYKLKQSIKLLKQLCTYATAATTKKGNHSHAAVLRENNRVLKTTNFALHFIKARIPLKWAHTLAYINTPWDHWDQGWESHAIALKCNFMFSLGIQCHLLKTKTKKQS